MGLDMGLYKKKKTQQGWHEEYEELCYWRKANQIREWFVEHLDDTVDNCKYSIVTEDDLQHLLQDIDKVLSDPGLAPLIIPTSSGFCFGSVEYDDWYSGIVCTFGNGISGGSCSVAFGAKTHQNRGEEISC